MRDFNKSGEDFSEIAVSNSSINLEMSSIRTRLALLSYEEDEIISPRSTAFIDSHNVDLEIESDLLVAKKKSMESEILEQKDSFVRRIFMIQTKFHVHLKGSMIRYDYS